MDIIYFIISKTYLDNAQSIMIIIIIIVLLSSLPSPYFPYSVLAILFFIVIFSRASGRLICSIAKLLHVVVHLKMLCDYLRMGLF
jgi:hypothetical protein